MGSWSFTAAPNHRRRTLTRRARCARRIALALLFTLSGCGDDPSNNAAPLPADPTEQRIVTFAPALTKMLVDLGVENRIVGVAEHDDAAPAGVPMVGHFLEPNREKLMAVRPTHVLLMTGRDGPPGSLLRLAESFDFEVVSYAYPFTIDDVVDILADPRTGVGAAVDRREQADQLAREMLRKLEALREITADRPRPRVLLAFGMEPTIMASGPGSVNDQLLDYVGATNAAADASISAPTFSREKLLALNPEVIILLSPNSPALASIDTDARFAILRGLSIDAVETGRIGLLNDPLILLPGTHLADVAAQMARIIHPDLAPQIDQLEADLDDANATQPDADD